jgi:hypothetical protein
MDCERERRPIRQVQQHGGLHVDCPAVLLDYEKSARPRNFKRVR